MPGTALALAEAGHELTIVTPAGMVAKEVERTAADIPIRKRLRELGTRFVTDAAVREWRGDAAVVTQFAGADELVPADTLVIAACNRPEDGLATELADSGLDVRARRRRRRRPHGGDGDLYRPCDILTYTACSLY